MIKNNFISEQKIKMKTRKKNQLETGCSNTSVSMVKLTENELKSITDFPTPSENISSIETDNLLENIAQFSLIVYKAYVK